MPVARVARREREANGLLVASARAAQALVAQSAAADGLDWVVPDKAARAV
jgi:hypothetical protein